MRSQILFGIAFLAVSFPATAQIVNVSPGTSYLAVTTPPSGAGGVCGVNCVNPNLGIPLNNYATSSTVDNRFADVNGRIDSLNSYAAAVGAMHDAIPNSGDRFAVRGSFSSVGNAVGGGVSASANIDSQLRASVNYGASRGKSVVSGSLNFSFN